MGGGKQPDFAEYLRLRRRRQAVDPIPEYEEFLGRIDVFFRLRAVAEERWKAHPHRAFGRNGALPLDWEEIAEVLRAGDGPAEKLITRIARERFVDVAAVGGNLRKTLLRLRERTPLGRIQQIDVGCLRWLTRQPGRTAVEKAGASQRILGVVRRENYDTLENRVFKDFLLRAAGQCGAYVEEFGKRYPGHLTLAKVHRFRNLCLGLLEDSVFEVIRNLDRLPTPNYVLQQDRHYSKIWKDYTLLVRQEDTAARLWTRKTEVDETWMKLHGEWPEWVPGKGKEGGVAFHTDPRALCATPLWFNVLDGRKSPLERPFWENRLGVVPWATPGKPPVEGDLAVVDLTGSDIWRELLVYGERENEKPHLQDYGRPNIEPAREWHPIWEILKGARTGSWGGIHVQRLRDYFEQLVAALGAARWVVVVPDDWPAESLERILASVPLARQNVFLLWRSVAACLDAFGRRGGHAGFAAGTDVAVLDGQVDGSVMVSKLELVECKGRFVPRRLAYRRTVGNRFLRVWGKGETEPNKTWMAPNPISTYIREDTAKAAAAFARGCPTWVVTGTFTAELAHSEANGIIRVLTGDVVAGGRLFDRFRRRGGVAYYDELEGLYLVVSRKDKGTETPVAVPLVAANERFPGGAEYKGADNREFTLKQGESSLKIYLAEGSPTPSTALKLSTTDLDKPTQEAERLIISTRMTPGQGLAQCTFRFESGRLPRPVRIDLSKMKDPPQGEPRTLLEIAESMPRSYPPDLPLVEASANLFELVRPEVEAYIQGREANGKMFAQARYIPVPPNPSPIDWLRRENVFGNAPGKELPHLVRPFDFDALFRKLAKDCAFDEWGGCNATILRLIAWTYQSEYPAFKTIKAKLLRRYERGYSPGGGAVGYTLLANLCANAKDLSRLFAAICEKFKYGIAGRSTVSQTHIRLLYNMLQFHPSVLEAVQTTDCEELMSNLQTQYLLWRDRGGADQSFNALLRSMLFLLNRRRYDPEFFRVKWDDTHLPDWIAQPFSRTVTEKLRTAFVAYVCGKGTLSGIPRDDD